MELFNQRIESTATMIKLFKVEQERLLLNAQDDKNFNTRLKTGKYGDVSSNATEASLSETFQRMLNTDCVIMPHCIENKSYQKLWPQALIVNRSKNCAEVGLIESHGSLWKVVPCAEGVQGARVMLQTAERGEVPRYLSSDLDIVELKVDAAVWAVKIVPPSPAAAGSSSSNSNKSSNNISGDSSRNYFGGKDRGVRMADTAVDTVGVIVVFELVNGPGQLLQEQGTGVGNNSKGASKVQVQERELLVCETSRELRSYSELFVEPVPVTAEGLPMQDVQQGQGQQDVQQGEHPTYRSCQWELFAEDWIQNDLDFLQGFII